MTDLENQAARILSEFLRINTTNPPGNESLAVDFLGRVLREAGVDFQVYEAKPGRASLLARVRGRGKQKPLVLLNHTDVVPADASAWTRDPFGGEIADGFIWGRGALDMKSQGIMQLLAFLELARCGRPLSRDCIFLAVADEEEGGGQGAGYLAENHWDELDPGLVLTEGGMGITDLLPDRPVMMVSAAEKGICWLEVEKAGTPGHGSSPHGDNAAEGLVLALSRVLAAENPVRVTPLVREYFQAIGAHWDFFKPFNEDPTPENLEKILTSSGLLALPQVRPMVQNTLSLTRLDSGKKHNVIPAKARAVLDARLLPGQEPEAFVEGLKAAAGDPGLTWEVKQMSPASESPVDNEDFKVISRVMQQAFPKALVVRSLLFGATDARFFRFKGVPSYGVCPIWCSMGDLSMLHGIDEKISVENLALGTRVFTDLAKGLCLT